MIRYVHDFSHLSWSTPASKWVSLLLPSRQRFDHLLRALTILLEHTEKPERIEIILGLDQDDTASISRLGELPEPWDITALIRAERGYQSLFHYANTMAQAACGEFLLFYTDDVLMKTKNWDSYIVNYLGQPCVLRPYTGQRFNIFPLISRSLCQMMGHIALHPCADTWIEDIGMFMGIEHILPDLELTHDLSEEQTGAKNLRDNVDSYFSEAAVQARTNDVSQIIAQVSKRLAKNPILLPADPYLKLWKIYYGIHSSHITYSRPKIVQSLKIPDTLKQMAGSEEQLVKGALVTQNFIAACFFERHLKPDTLPTHYEKKTAYRISLLQEHLLETPTYFWLWYQLGLLHLWITEDSRQARAALQQAWQLLNTQTAWHPIGLLGQVTPFAAPWLVHAWEKLDWESQPQEREPQQLGLVRGQIQSILLQLGLELGPTSDDMASHPASLWQLTNHALETGKTEQAYSLIQVMQEHYPFLLNTWDQLPLLCLRGTNWQSLTLLLQNQSWRPMAERQALLNLQALLKAIQQGKDTLELLQQQGFSAETYSLLKQLAPSAWKPFWPIGGAVIAPLPFGWNLLPAEHTGFGVHDISGMGMERPDPGDNHHLRLEWNRPASLPGEWQRVYDQPTDWKKGLIGPDELPFSFPWQAQALEIDGIGEQTLLVMTSDWEQLDFIPLLAGWLAELERFQGSVLLWNPLECPTEQQTQALAALLPDTEVPITLISEPLTPEEQAYLMKQVKALLLNPTGCLNYYYWWSWFQGTPAWGITSAYNPYGFEPQADANRPAGELGKPQHPSHFLLNPERAWSQQLEQFYQTEAENRIANLVWKLKLNHIRTLFTHSP